MIFVFSNIFSFFHRGFFFLSFFFFPIVCFCFFCGACFCVSRSSSSSGGFVVAGSLIRGKNSVCVCIFGWSLDGDLDYAWFKEVIDAENLEDSCFPIA